MKTYHSEFIKDTIEKKGILKKHLSQKTGIEMPEISNFIHGKRPLPLHKIEKLMKELDIFLDCKE